MTTPKGYYRPKTFAEVLERTQHPGAILRAGSTLTLDSGLLPYDTVIDVQDIPELTHIETSERGTSFGAALPLQTVLDWEYLADGLRRALTRTIPPNLRAAVTIGESLRRWQTPLLREWITGLLAYDVGIEYVQSADERAWDNIIGRFADERLDRDLITTLSLPALEREKGQAFGTAYIAPTPTDLPIVNAAAFVYIGLDHLTQSAFVFVSGTSAQPIIQVGLPTLTDNPFDEANIGSTVKVVVPQLEPVSDDLGSAEFRREMARVVVQNALLECLEQLQ